VLRLLLRQMRGHRLKTSVQGDVRRENVTFFTIAVLRYLQ
jgi:hypothetical protein